MGIQGLLPCLRSITSAIHISKYSGRRVAIDAYSWLHKGAYSCSRELCEGTPTDKYITYCMDRVRLLRGCGVVPVVVFDGGRLPIKGFEEASRARSRKEHLDRAAAHLRAGNGAAANDCFQKAVDISPATAKRFIEALKREGIEFIVAPYEADAQMAYLALSGDVEAVITEDSDLLAYGCPKVLFKMDRSGECQEIALEDLNINRELNLVGFTPQMFLETCIMAGCDFVKALPGIGMKKAHQHIRRLRSFVRVSKSLRFSCAVPRSYEEDVQRAVWTFRHQRVFCPRARAMVHLRTLPEGGLAATAAVPAAVASGDAALDFLGPLLPDIVACKIAAGDLDPITLRPFELPAAQPAGSPHAARNLGPAAGAGPSQGGLLDYFLPHARVSQQAKSAFRPPGIAAPGSGGLMRSAERPAAVASVHSEGCLSQPESSAAEAPTGGPRPGDIRRYGQRSLAASDSRSERAPPQLLPPGGQRRHATNNTARAPPAQQSDGEEVSPPRAHPLAARPPAQRRAQAATQHVRKPGPSATADAGQPAKRACRQSPATAGNVATGRAAAGGRVLQELPLPPSNGRESGASAALGRQHTAPAQLAAEHGDATTGRAAAPPTGAAGSDAAAELKAGFGDLSHMRRYAVEASKALDSLKRQRHAPGKGGRPPEAAASNTRTPGKSGTPARTPGKSGTPSRTAKQVEAATAARATIERFKQQLPRPPGRTPPKGAAAQGGGGQRVSELAAERAAAEPAAGDPAEPAATAAIAAATPARHRCSTMADGASADLSGELNPQILPDWRAGGGSFGPDSLVAESPAFGSPAFSLPASLPRSCAEPRSPTSGQRQRPPPGLGFSCSPALSVRRLPMDDDSGGGSAVSPWRRRRRLSAGCAISDGWLDDPSDDEADLLAAEDAAEQRPPGGGPSEEDRLFSLALGRGAFSAGAAGAAAARPQPAAACRRRSSIGGPCLSGVSGLEGIIDGSDPVETFSPSPTAAAAGMPFGNCCRPKLQSPLQPRPPLQREPAPAENPLFSPCGSGGGGGGGGAPGRAASSPWASATREWSDGGDSGDESGAGACSSRRPTTELLGIADADDGSGGGHSAAALLGLADHPAGRRRCSAEDVLGLRRNGSGDGGSGSGGPQGSAAQLLGLDENESMDGAGASAFSPSRRQHGHFRARGSSGGGSAAFVAELQRREEAAEATTPCMRTAPACLFDSQRAVIAESPVGSSGVAGGGGGAAGGRHDDCRMQRSGSLVAASLGLPKIDDRAELDAALAGGGSLWPGSSGATDCSDDDAEPALAADALWQAQPQPKVKPASSHPASNCFGRFAFRRDELSLLTR